MQLKWKSLQRTVPRVGTLMGPIAEVLREKLFPALFREGETNANFWQILGHSVRHDSFGILESWLSVESAYNTSKADSGELVESILGGSTLYYVGHMSCVGGESTGVSKERIHVELMEPSRRKYLADGQERNRLLRSTRNGA